MGIYTKTGDKGETGLFNQAKRIPKYSLEIEVLGTIDEANSFLGLAASSLSEQFLKNKVTQVQRNLFKLGSIVAGAKFSISKSVVNKYEKEIDAWTNMMPPLSNFVFPGGSKPAAFLFTARTVVRRAERLIVKLSCGKEINPNVLIYINRLGDYLFTLARYVNFREGVKESYWKNSK
ncbi:MAG: cob(I)yrinic acid a,c-diamide adenosyltransferase [Candidatus Woesebacteria bacterium]|nr:cob(I)yrinic acid a,c-diamide adenosyltransferase [Candidatus Woesebacteria bacterium]